jgi:hypothetical protein
VSPTIASVSLFQLRKFDVAIPTDFESKDVCLADLPPALPQLQLKPANPKPVPPLEPLTRASDIPLPIRVPPAEPPTSNANDCRVTEVEPSQGILSYLVKAHKAGIYLGAIVDITLRDEGLWRSWNFGKMRVTLTRYSIWFRHYRPSEATWRVDGSLNGRDWTELDRRSGGNDDHDGCKEDLWNGKTFQFAVSKRANCRFIRITRTDWDEWRPRLLNGDFDMKSKYGPRPAPLSDTREAARLEAELSRDELRLRMGRLPRAGRDQV